MSISNPCCWFATGGGFDDQVWFTYEGGKHLYHFCSGGNRSSINTGWTPGYMGVNIVFFANDEEHARSVLKRMLEFRMKAAEQYRHAGDKRLGQANIEQFLESNDRVYKTCGEWLARIDEAIFTLAPTNQLYTVGWACNDTIL